MLTIQINTSQWCEDPIVFIAESPSKDYGFYVEKNYNGINKKPTRDWYWVHDTREYYEYPEKIALGEYGGLICSLINTFKLKNTYFTNLVKCSLNNKDGKFKNITEFTDDCLTNCYSRFLQRELDIMSPKVVFALGSNTYNYFARLSAKKYEDLTINLPHPAARGVNNQLYKTMVLWTITRALYKRNIIDEDKTKEILGKYMNE